MVQIDREILRQGEGALEQTEDRTFYRAYGKRAFDLVIGTTLFLLAVPVILILGATRGVDLRMAPVLCGDSCRQGREDLSALEAAHNGS